MLHSSTFHVEVIYIALTMKTPISLLTLYMPEKRLYLHSMKHEKEILYLLRQGKPYAYIQEVLRVSPSSISRVRYKYPNTSILTTTTTSTTTPITTTTPTTTSGEVEKTAEENVLEIPETKKSKRIMDTILGRK